MFSILILLGIVSRKHVFWIFCRLETCVMGRKKGVFIRPVLRNLERCSTVGVCVCDVVLPFHETVTVPELVAEDAGNLA